MFHVSNLNFSSILFFATTPAPTPTLAPRIVSWLANCKPQVCRGVEVAAICIPPSAHIPTASTLPRNTRWRRVCSCFATLGVANPRAGADCSAMAAGCIMRTTGRHTHMGEEGGGGQGTTSTRLNLDPPSQGETHGCHACNDTTTITATIT